jgi:hypothetical protein
MDRFDFLRTRLLPAVLTATGVTMLAAGLLTYTVPVAAEPAATPTPRATAAVATPSPRLTLPPLGSPTPAPSPSPAPDRVATRVRIAALDIDLPVIKGPKGYPKCDVAMYLVDPADPPRLGQPGQGRATYIFAHARPGMFEPLLRTKAAKIRGSIVEVWTSDDQLFLYEIVEVRRGQTDLIEALSADKEELWLQTSEGPKGTPGKTQVLALPLSVTAADPPSDAHPKAKPRSC